MSYFLFFFKHARHVSAILDFKSYKTAEMAQFKVVLELKGARGWTPPPNYTLTLRRRHVPSPSETSR